MNNFRNINLLVLHTVRKLSNIDPSKHKFVLIPVVRGKSGNFDQLIKKAKKLFSIVLFYVSMALFKLLKKCCSDKSDGVLVSYTSL